MLVKTAKQLQSMEAATVWQHVSKAVLMASGLYVCSQSPVREQRSG